MCKTVDEEGGVEQPAVAYNDGHEAEVPGLAPAINRYEGRYNEGQGQHYYLEVPADKRDDQMLYGNLILLTIHTI